MEILKSAVLERAETANEGELALINKQTLRELTAEEVFTFKLAACDNQADRDFERFTDDALKEMADLFVGKTVLTDHRWSAGTQTARVYAAEVEAKGEIKRLILHCYMPRTEKTAETITAIESGILRECSVGVAVSRSVCSICGVDNCRNSCPHCHGAEYDGKICHFELDGIVDAYEVSLVAVPAQKDAGIIKSKRYGGCEKTLPETGEPSRDVSPQTKSLQLRLRAAEARAKAAGCSLTDKNEKE